MQVAQELRPLCQAHKFKVYSIYGGVSMQLQKENLRGGCHIVVATPGRLLDHVVQGSIKLDAVRHVVLDEGDVMLEMGFQRSVESVLSTIKSPGGEAMEMVRGAIESFDSSPDERRSYLKQSRNRNFTASRAVQTLLFSATMPEWVSGIVGKHQTNPVLFDAVQEGETRLAEGIEHIAISLPQSRSDRMNTFSSYLSDVVTIHGDGGQAIVFTATKSEADELFAADCFKDRRVGILHGDISQNTRQQVLKSFKGGNLDILVATDVAARGLDISGVDLVIQLSPPRDGNTYVHRSGRTGRAGRNGTSVLFYSPEHAYLLQSLEKTLNVKFRREGPPSLVAVANSIAEAAVNTFLSSQIAPGVLRRLVPHSAELMRQLEERAVLPAAVSYNGTKMYTAQFVKSVLTRSLAILTNSKIATSR